MKLRELSAVLYSTRSDPLTVWLEWGETEAEDFDVMSAECAIENYGHCQVIRVSATELNGYPAVSIKLR